MVCHARHGDCAVGADGRDDEAGFDEGVGSEVQAEALGEKKQVVLCEPNLRLIVVEHDVHRARVVGASSNTGHPTDAGAGFVAEVGASRVVFLCSNDALPGREVFLGRAWRPGGCGGAMCNAVN